MATCTHHAMPQMAKVAMLLDRQMTRVSQINQYMDRPIAVGDKSSHLGRPPIVKPVSEKAIIRMRTVTEALLLQSGKNQCLDP